MITIEGLKAYGANVEEGLARCMNKEEFYLMLVGKVVKDPAFDQLKTAVDAKDLDAAFEAAHRLKGVLANLALTPLCETVNEMVELLRVKTEADYAQYCEVIESKRKRLEEMI